VKIRPPSACNPARFARHCLARVTRDSSVRLLARERCGIRARCVRVLDARRAWELARVFVVVRSRPSSTRVPARFQRLEEPSSACARRRRGGRRTRPRRRRRRRRPFESRRRGEADDARGRGDDDDATTTTRRRGDSTRDAFVVTSSPRGCIDSNVFIHSCAHSIRMRPLALCRIIRI
jgi:hypothetical protein